MNQRVLDSALSHCKRGEKHPQGSSLQLPNLVEKKGLKIGA